jgi:hypothetical protein
LAEAVSAGPFDKIVETTFTVTNPGPTPVLFKVKTTAPKSYMVRPNSGKVNAGQSIEVQGNRLDLV